MTPRTRTSNKDANYKTFYSKKVPQQTRSPHRRKTVRRPETAEQAADATRQMRFLPEKMRHKEDQDEEQSEEGLHVRDEEIVHSKPVRRERGGKRKENDFQEAPDSEAKPTNTSSKRRRRETMPNEGFSRPLRRQSTMTQLADGRRPSIGADDLDFKPVKRRSRVSWGGKSSKERDWDKKQRTLTQMIPGIGRLNKEELEDLSDLDADLDDDGTDKNAVSRSLVEQGLLESDAPEYMAASVQLPSAQVLTEEEQHSLPDVLRPQSFAIVQSVEAIAEDHDGEDYHPTQFIDAPALRTRQTSRRASARKASSTLAELQTSRKSRFSLLSTPEKRRIIEIPSSQSPAESVPSSHVSPEKSQRTALQERTSNTSFIAETPSKRRQITFKEPSIQPAPPARLRKFESTVQDSEEEEESDLESHAAEREQSLVDREDHAADGYAVGAETQATLDRVELACTDTSEDVVSGSREYSQETEELVGRQGPYRSSPELGESWAPVIYDDDGPEFDSYRSSWPAGARYKLLRDVHASKDSPPLPDQISMVSQLDLTTQPAVPTNEISSTPPAMQPRTDGGISSTPMVIWDDSSDEEGMSKPNPPRLAHNVVSNPSSTLIHHSANLDGAPMQVPRSPSAERETQHSHSSKAEQQLQHEWLSYSQYVHARTPDSSSMHAAVDAFNYNTTPRPSKAGATSSSGIDHSQATTVDENTPKKNRTQRVISAHTTPQRSSKSQPFISPEKPPSLFIPSSFPSPSRIAMEGWSSPVAARTQNVYSGSQVMGSLEDFSIPLPPPIEDD